MRGQDIIIWVLLFFWRGSLKGRLNYLSDNTGLSKREIQQAFHRLSNTRLYDFETGKLNIKMFQNFYKEGIRYLCPWDCKAGKVVSGIPTIYPAIPNSIVTNELPPVWANADGNENGIALSPIHKSCFVIAKAHLKAYQFVCLLDAMRSYLPREREIASNKLDDVLNEV